MRIAPALVLSALVLLTAADALGAPPEGAGAQAAGALKTLEAARATLAKAVQRIEKDPPSTEDLDAAHAAVEALKRAIDSGADFEPKDLDYAKAALAARKELRTHREYVDQRRAKVHIHNHRRTIDAALATLNERAKAIEAKEPSPQDFDEARAATKALKKALDAGREFSSQDEKYGSYIAATDATLARQEKAIDDRWAALAADKHRALVEEGRKALKTAVGSLSKGASDAQFEAAERASSTLTKRLEEGKPLETRNKAYKAEADKAQAELVQSRKRMDELWSATGLARLTAEIEPAYKDLTAAAKALRARRPSPEQLAEARTAAIVVRKLIEKFQPQAALSQAFGQYVNEVKKTLVEVEVELQRRSLDAAQGDLLKALRNLERKAPTDEHFAEANTALVVLEKTLETVHARDPVLLKPVADARAWVRDAKKTMAKRRVEVDVQRHRAKVEEARRNAAAVVGTIRQPDAGPERLAEAEKAVEQVRAVLEQGSALIKQDRDYAAYDREVKLRIEELKERIEARRIALAASDGRAVLKDSVADAKAKLEIAKQPTATDAELEAASKGVDAVTKAIETRTALEKQDKGYAMQAERARGELVRLAEALEMARQAREIRKRTVEALAAGASAVEAASGKDLRAQKAQYDKAIAQFNSCEEGGKSMIAENRTLAGITVLVDGAPSTPKDVIALCAQRSKDAEQLLKGVVGLIAFEEGPKRAFEAGKGMLARGNKSEALRQFYECISSGMILQNKNPELKDRKFQVAGGSVTLSELTQQCIKHRESLKK